MSGEKLALRRRNCQIELGQRTLGFSESCARAGRSRESTCIARSGAVYSARSTPRARAVRGEEISVAANSVALFPFPTVPNTAPAPELIRKRFVILMTFNTFLCGGGRRHTAPSSSATIGGGLRRRRRSEVWCRRADAPQHAAGRHVDMLRENATATGG